MDQIYANALVNISADGAHDANSGFLRPRNELEWSECTHPNLVQELGWSTAQNERRVIHCGIIHAETSIANSPLNNRGWILQERLLSHRIIHWGAYEVSWECDHYIASERRPQNAKGPKYFKSLAWEVEISVAIGDLRKALRTQNNL